MKIMNEIYLNGECNYYIYVCVCLYIYIYIYTYTGCGSKIWNNS